MTAPDDALREAAKKFYHMCKGPCPECSEKMHLIEFGAAFERERILKMLRSEDAPRNMAPPYPYNHQWADWLESELWKSDKKE